MKYFLSVSNPASKFIDIELHVEKISTDKICFQLPSWRPGRYELGNFAKNIQRWEVFDENNTALSFQKITKDKWEVETKDVKKVVVRYNYFAAQLDAGSCWLDDSQLYVNPIQCLLFINERRNESTTVELTMPANWKIAGNASEIKNNILVYKNYEELVDSPFIASSTLMHHMYESHKIQFHIWIQGNCKPDFIRIEKDFKNFTDAQIKMMGDFPSAHYHFLIQVLPYNFYHGVEHTASTVLAIGPGYDLMNEPIYSELIGLASHELFHVWNIKMIRPAEMLPYDYSKENYSRLGYVYEGFTTYYGDLILKRTGFFTLEKYLAEVSLQYQKHMDNYGRFNYSVAQSSFDTWLDGYQPGIPNRKTSIYTEGSFIAMMLDIMIRKFTSGKKSLDDAMRMLYYDFAKKNIGYTESDIINIIDKISGQSFKSFFENYVNKPISYDAMLEELLLLSGIRIEKSTASKIQEKKFGFRIENANGLTKVNTILPDSPAAKAGLSKDDEIVAVNNIKIEKNINELFKFFENDTIVIHAFSQKKIKTFTLVPDQKNYFDLFKLAAANPANQDQSAFQKLWLSD